MKKVLFVREPDVEVDLEAIAANLNRISRVFSFEYDSNGFVLHTELISAPDSYKELSPRLLERAKGFTYICLFSLRPYDNNFFYEEHRNLVIISGAYWHHLTTLPMNNGVVYMVASLISQGILESNWHHGTTGCIFDFLVDKRGIDIGMRSASVCAVCLKKVQRSLKDAKRKAEFSDLQAILNDVSSASRWNQDIVEFWRPHSAQADKFDVFLCHNSEDKDRVRELANQLRTMGVKPWLDEEQIRPGTMWQAALEDAIDTINCAMVTVGSDGITPWQDMESAAFLRKFVQRRSPVIPVLLESVTETPQLPTFLSGMMWVDFRKSRPDPMKQLLWGITERQ